MKITILGRGNAGCFTALYFAAAGYSEGRKDYVELIHDKDILPEKVGQGTLLDPPRILWAALGINWYDNPIDATLKAGILYENWGKKKEKSFFLVSANEDYPSIEVKEEMECFIWGVVTYIIHEATST